MLIFIGAFFFGSGGWSDFQRNRRERKEMFAREAARDAELREYRRAERDAS